GIALSVAAAFPADLDRPADTIAMLRALDWLSGREVAVINFSLSGPRNDIVGEALTGLDEAGVTLVAAVGNGETGTAVRFPATHPAVLGVTAVGPDGAVLAVAAQGPAVDLAAPGIAVPTLGAGGQPIRATGTSFAAPFATAAAALLALEGRAPAEIRQRLAAASRDAGAPGRDDVYGHGTLVAPGCADAAFSRRP
ncbi:MAG: S8 family serine peptidase, partial [Azospirillaceae bacterium]